MESVRDYPVRPRVEPSPRRVRVAFGGEVVADSKRAHRVIERGHPPAYYVPREDVRDEFLRPNARTTFCEWKGEASYLDLVVRDRVAERAAWTYPDPMLGFAELQDAVAFYAGKVDEAWLDDERATPEASSFYGGWITGEISP
jgi:uncharacterized protein (DUF427 family)